MSRPWFPFYVGDYLKDTGNLGTLGHGAYLLLILHYWEHDGLPDDEEELAAICRLSAPEWERMRLRLSKFFHDGWKHKRVEEELAKSADKYAKRAEAGKKGGNATAKAKQTDGKQPSNADSNDTSNAPASAHQPHSKLDSSSRSVSDVPRETLEEVSSESRDQAAPSVANLPTEPSAIYGEAELQGFAFEFDGMDTAAAIHELAHWTNRRGVTDLIQRKNMIYGGMQKRHAKFKLQASLKAPSVAASASLLSSKMVRGARPKSTAELEAELVDPEFLLRRKTG